MNTKGENVVSCAPRSFCASSKDITFIKNLLHKTSLQGKSALASTHSIFVNSSSVCTVNYVNESKGIWQVLFNDLVHLVRFTNARTVNNHYPILKCRKKSVGMRLKTSHKLTIEPSSAHAALLFRTAGSLIVLQDPVYTADLPYNSVFLLNSLHEQFQCVLSNLNKTNAYPVFVVGTTELRSIHMSTADGMRLIWHSGYAPSPESSRRIRRS